MIDVYVRETSQADGHLLGSFFPADLEPLVEVFSKFDSYISIDEGETGPCTFEDCQFIASAKGVVFEIVIYPYKD